MPRYTVQHRRGSHSCDVVPGEIIPPPPEFDPSVLGFWWSFDEPSLSVTFQLAHPELAPLGMWHSLFGSSNGGNFSTQVLGVYGALTTSLEGFYYDELPWNGNFWLADEFTAARIGPFPFTLTT
jgi:hypothetical protein